MNPSRICHVLNDPSAKNERSLRLRPLANKGTLHVRRSALVTILRLRNYICLCFNNPTFPFQLHYHQQSELPRLPRAFSILTPI